MFHNFRFALKCFLARDKIFKDPNFDRVLLFSGLKKNTMLKDDNIFFQRFRKAFDGIRVDIELGKPQNLFKLISDDLARGKHILIVLGILYLLYILYLKGA